MTVHVPFKIPVLVVKKEWTMVLGHCCTYDIKFTNIQIKELIVYVLFNYEVDPF